MNKWPKTADLAGLYRRHARGEGVALPDPDALIALADGESPEGRERLLADVAGSALHADLLRFTRALAPESARLAVQVEQAFDASRSAPARRRPVSRRAQLRRHGLRLVAGIAASLLVAVAFWSLQRHGELQPGAKPVVAAPHAAPDRIFAALDDKPAKGDEIFRAQFRDDRIFHGEFNGG